MLIENQENQLKIKENNENGYQKGNGSKLIEIRIFKTQKEDLHRKCKIAH